MAKPITKEIFLERIHKKYGNLFELVGDYKTYTTKTEFKCNNCGNIFLSTPANLCEHNKVGCEKCCYKYRNNNEIPKDNFIKKLKEINPDFILIGDYKNTKSEAKFKHLKCGNEFITVAQNLIYQKRSMCPKCKNNVTNSIDKIKEKIKEMYGNEYTLLSKEYHNNKEYLEFRHNKCGKTFKMKWYCFASNRNTCPHCIGRMRFNKDEFIKIFNENNGDFYEIVGEFKALSRPIKLKHKLCGEIFEVNEARQILYTTSCPKCYHNISKGEAIIKEYLDRNNIVYERQKSFKDLKRVNKLKFDFYIPSENLLIEFDGIQHFDEDHFFHEYDFDGSLSITQERDQIKNNYILNSDNLALVRIKYNQNIIKILNDIFRNNCIDEDVYFVYGKNYYG